MSLNDYYKTELGYTLLQYISIEDLFNVLVSCKFFANASKHSCYTKYISLTTSKNISFIEHKKKQYINLLQTLKDSPYTLYYIKDQNKEMCLTAIQSNINSAVFINYIPIVKIIDEHRLNHTWGSSECLDDLTVRIKGKRRKI